MGYCLLGQPLSCWGSDIGAQTMLARVEAICTIETGSQWLHRSQLVVNPLVEDQPVDYMQLSEWADQLRIQYQPISLLALLITKR